MMKYIFWISLSVLVYTYLGYPLYLVLRSRFSNGRVRKDPGYKPMVSVVMSAYNEEACMERKIGNLLNSNYPADKIEILVGSDGSCDRTNEILLHASDRRVRPFIFSKRRGKVSVLNDMVPNARGEVVVFCDVRQVFDSDVISELAANFSDERVGCVSGELIFEKTSSANGVSEGVGVYWNYEKMIRRKESAIHSMVGATGAIYAIRRELFKPSPGNTILDDVSIPLAIVRQGYRSIWCEEAKAYDRPSVTPEEEYKRKVRTLAGNYQIFIMFKDLFIPFRNPVAVPLLSHKLLRVLAPFFMISLFASNLLISKKDFYTVFLTCQMIFYALALLGSLTYDSPGMRRMAKIASTVYIFCLMNFTAIAGLYRFLAGTQDIAWEK